MCDLESFAFKPGNRQIQAFLLSIVLLGIMKHYIIIIIKSISLLVLLWLGVVG